MDDATKRGLSQAIAGLSDRVTRDLRFWLLYSTLPKWRQFTRRLLRSRIPENHAAWVIQSLWRARLEGSGPEDVPDFRPYLELTLDDFQRAEIAYMRSISDEILTSNLKAIIGSGDQDEEGEVEADGDEERRTIEEEEEEEEVDEAPERRSIEEEDAVEAKEGRPSAANKVVDGKLAEEKASEEEEPRE
jgi:hypothetical protein